MIAAALLLAGPAWAADPWGRPEHLRVVEGPAEEWAELDAERAAVRLFWDADGRAAEVQMQRRAGWRTVATAVRSGWESRSVPRGTAFRVRPAGATRWSAPVTAPAWTDPTALARLAADGPAALAGDVGEVVVSPANGAVWASTLGGGLVEVGRDGEVVRAWGRFDGLPDARVVAVAAGDGGVLVGTARGAAWIAGGAVQRVWDEALDDAYVQAVAVEGGRLWAGTWRGLERLMEDGRAVRSYDDGAVYSLTPAAGGGVWIGSTGLAWVGADGEIVGGADHRPRPLSEQRLYDALDLGEDGVLVASLETGPRWLGAQELAAWRAAWVARDAAAAEPDATRPGADAAAVGLMGSGVLGAAAGGAAPATVAPPEGRALPAYLPDSAYSLARTGHGLWVAAGAAGVFGPEGALVGAHQGVDAGAVWSLAADPADRLWVGSDRGLWRVQLSPAPKQT